MPKGPSPRIPSYRLHKPTGLAAVRLNGHDFYLGKHGSPQSKADYQRLIAEWLAHNRQSRQLAENTGNGTHDNSALTVNELIVSYWKFAETYYVKNGRPTGELVNLRAAARPLVNLYGSALAADFGPLALETVRQEMINADLCRTGVNSRVNRIRRIFKWGVAKQLVPAPVLQGLQALSPLKKGRGNVRESKPVRAVADALVDAVLPHLPSPLRAMVELQRLTGMRPGEITSMRTCDLDTTGKIWTYRPESHKTEHHDRQRLIYLGPQAQKAVKPFLKTDLQAWIFSPRGALAERHAACPNHRRQPNLNRKTRRKVGDRYYTASYERAITYACASAFPPPTNLVTTPKGETDQQKTDRLTKLRQWRRDHHWHPNQLRHNAATFIRKQYGLDAARVILGHSSPVVTEVYAELDYAKAVQIMSEIG